jgi:hypothetical protein
MANSTVVPNVPRFSFAREDVFGITGYICPTCFTIKSAVFLYSSFSNMLERSPIIKFIDSCHTCNSQMTNKERNHYLKYNLVNGIAPLLLNWIKVFWPEDQKMKLVAIRVNELDIESPGDCPAILPPTVNKSSPRQRVTRLRIEASGKSPSLTQKSILLDRDEEPVFEVKTIFQRNSNHTVPLPYFDSFPIIRAIEESEYLITSEKDIYSFLHYTMFKTFGLFRLSFGLKWFGNIGNTQDDEEEIYLVMLVPNEFSLPMRYTCETNHEIVVDSASSA